VEGLPQRIQPNRYLLVPRTLVFVQRDEYLLLIKYSSLKGSWSGYYNGLGGHLEESESPVQAAVREVHEETGLTLAKIQLRALITIHNGNNPGVLLMVFMAAPTTNAGILHQSTEGEVCWIHQKDLGTLSLMPDLHQLLPRIISSVNGSVGILTGSYSYETNGELDIVFDPITPTNSAG